MTLYLYYYLNYYSLFFLAFFCLSKAMQMTINRYHFAKCRKENYTVLYKTLISNYILSTICSNVCKHNIIHQTPLFSSPTSTPPAPLHSATHRVRSSYSPYDLKYRLRGGVTAGSVRYR